MQFQWLRLVLHLPEDQTQTRKMKFEARNPKIYKLPQFGGGQLKSNVQYVKIFREKWTRLKKYLCTDFERYDCPLAHLWPIIKSRFEGFKKVVPRQKRAKNLLCQLVPACTTTTTPTRLS
jgi:hypothetical protein